MWNAKNIGGYTLNDDAGKENTSEIGNYLMGLEPNAEGHVWTIEAVSAMVGNMLNEGQLNPWRWENDYVASTIELAEWYRRYHLNPSDPNYSTEIRNHGYGLVGFTPATDYINSNNATTLSQYGYAPNFSNSPGYPTDGAAQMVYIIENFAYWWGNVNGTVAANIKNNYADTFEANGFTEAMINRVAWMTREDFIQGLRPTDSEHPNPDPATLVELAAAFMVHFEKPSYDPETNHLDRRINDTVAVYEYFQENPPAPYIPSIESNWKFYLFL